MGRTSKPSSAKAAKPAKSGRTKTPTERGKAHQQKLKKAAKKNKTFDELDSEDEEGSEDDDVDEGDLKSGDKTMAFDWSDPALTQALITCIMEDRDIKRALYPPPGPNASTAKGGGKTKTSSHWQLCLNLLGEDPKYKEALAMVTTAKERLAYANKIKNRLRTVARMTRQYMDEMGQTGAGIRSADEIDMTVTNSFTTRWAEISSTCPWFFDMRELIAQRPNLIPIGLGHSGSEFDDDVLSTGPPPHADELDPTDAEGAVIAQGFDDNISSDDEEVERDTPFEIHDASDSDFPIELSTLVGSDIDYRPSDDAGLNAQMEEDDGEDKPKKKSKGKAGRASKKTPAHPGTSNPTPPPIPTAAPKPSKKTQAAEFADIAKTEEVTRQKELDLAKIKAQQSLKVLDLKSRLEAQKEERKREERQARREERREKLKIKQMKLQHAHELRMAQLTSSHTVGFSDTHLHASSSSHALPAYSNFGSVSSGPGSATSFDFEEYNLPPPSYE
ncbi:hypothetical protein DFH07DRAFT_967741 [Mycena maculata]|uniref:No apical meristem-associated C-terminal domain-containing protein n=1 Tax=Mycena maculata TaxID=230809 RepID=A0AAD7I3E2_9AGAR|nr:hypothetical protein DFH07DRAFT_967741 [Mycena maculata]